MVLQEIVGKWLDGSGWEKIITEAGVLSSCRTHSVLGAYDIKRTHYSHQVTLAALHILREEAYSAYSRDEETPQESWCASMVKQ